MVVRVREFVERPLDAPSPVAFPSRAEDSRSDQEVGRVVSCCDWDRSLRAEMFADCHRSRIRASHARPTIETVETSWRVLWLAHTSISRNS